MTSLHQLAELRTLAEIRSILGKPYSPCSKCGSPYFSILHTGEPVCWGCEWDRAHTKLVSLEIVVLCRPDGTGYAVERQAAEAEQERYRLLRSIARERGGRIIPTPSGGREAAGAGRDAGGGAATLPWMQAAADAAAGREAPPSGPPSDWLVWTRPDGGRSAIRLAGRSVAGIRRELEVVHPPAGADLPAVYNLIDGALVPGGELCSPTSQPS